MKALILAAGYATRLYPLTKVFPKPLLRVDNKPIIDYIFEKLDAVKEIDEVFVITNSKFISRFKVWKKHCKSKKRISLIDDLTRSNDDRLGAIGDMYFAIKKYNIQDDLLVIGGDNLFDAEFNPFFNFAKAHQNGAVIGVYNLKEKKEASRYGVVKVDRANRIIDFQEKPDKPKTKLVAMCLYYFPKGRLRLLREYLARKKKFDATGLYIDWLRKRIPVYAFIFGGKWYDIGDHKFYNKAKTTF